MTGPWRESPQPRRSRAPQALVGVKIADFTRVIAGPWCTRLLADMGADVVKIEPPGGDDIRARPPFREGHSAYFTHLNDGKTCIRLDLKSEDGLAEARRIALESDVVLENFRPGVMARFSRVFSAMPLWRDILSLRKRLRQRQTLIAPNKKPWIRTLP